MASLLKFLAAFAVALELITDQIKKYVDAKEKQKIQQVHNDIDRNPGAAFVCKFNPDQKTNSEANIGERNDPT